MFLIINTYDPETASYIRNIKKSSIDSNMQEFKKNAERLVQTIDSPEKRADIEQVLLGGDRRDRLVILLILEDPLGIAA